MTKLLRLVRDTRPRPPEDMELLSFVPAPDVGDWVRRTFIDEAGPLHNPDHSHLQQADIGWLWTDIGNDRNMRSVVGQCELMPPMAMGKWQKARAVYQIERWFGGMPDFIITLFAPWLKNIDDASFCAVIEHELYHASMDGWKENGEPRFAIKGHDVEEFVGVIARYGVGVDTAVTAMVQAANRGPSIAQVSLDMACGTCEKRKRA